MSFKRLALVALSSLLLSGAAGAFDLEAHRGGRALWPENTLPAFANAIALGVTTLELDTGISKDGTLIIAHERHVDTHLARGADGQWVTAPTPSWHSLTLAEIGRYDVGRIRPDSDYAKRFSRQQSIDGTRIPTLASLFDLVKAKGADQVRFNIETKIDPTAPADTVDPEQFAHTLVEAVRKAGMENRVTIQSFDWRTLLVVQRIAPAIPTAYLTIDDPEESNVTGPKAAAWTAGFAPADHGGSVPAAVKAAGGKVWSPYYRNLSKELVAQAKALGLQVLPWTVDDAAAMRQLIDWKVDGIITDDPILLRQVMAEKGLALPAAGH
ncbi:glycerophosphodiester phosphodiesterase [Niveispirillum sp. SYP-B3756]|uniref:glycerophosphodiester phosphodiesterase n=1 Tax=Niveispirillum sp. SYP-B3756 TaxID=2662178 RepID=UPI001290B8B4|nr:glycerophosphodiester phosphodiesterase [Niveispirillum sp. SYP-B3756]MQP65164.1 glycerophosphodiester phosphodiesterase [Niveispirillum sp. SYP-B3756]